MRDEVHMKNYGIDSEISLHEFLQLYICKGNLESQICWINGFDGDIPLDYIGRFENLASDFEYIADYLKLPSKLLPHKIEGSGEDYRKYYNNESIKIVAECYNKEIELFDYTFE